MISYFFIRPYKQSAPVISQLLFKGEFIKSQFFQTKTALLTFVIMLVFPFQALAETITEAQKIEVLIKKIENLGEAVFIRNGNEHTPKDAADHMRLKLGNAGSRIKTAEDFIKYCGTGSSMTGEAYKIRFKDGSERLSSDVLNGFLKEMQPKK